MKITGFIARRYLFSRKHISLISTLTSISIAGVTVGTALLIVVLSVFNGFFKVIKGYLLQNDPDIRIELAEGGAFLYTQSMQDKIAGIPEVDVQSAFISGKALMVKSKDSDKVVSIKGIRREEYFHINDLAENITRGQADLGVQNKKPGMLVPEQLMAEMNLNVGDELALLSAGGMRKSLTQFSLPRTYRFEIRGSYSQIQIIEGAAIFIDKRAAQRLFELRSQVSGIDLRLTNSSLANEVKEKLHRSLGDKYAVSTWYDLQQPLYDVMYLEKWSSYVILMIIVIVAILNIIGSLTMIVIQKKRDMGVLQTIGFRPADIKGIFVRQGFYIGLIGCIIGGGLGLLLSWLQKQYGLIKLSSAFIIDAYPVSIEFFDVTIVLAGSLLLCLLASWYPARRASTIEPADAIRYD
ncbi:MAG TPA: FtsX-like permease family protein [Fodinibius sp.]|nr:FtsX-like permease family protein [Fodinibius sp.]